MERDRWLWEPVQVTLWWGMTEDGATAVWQATYAETGESVEPAVLWWVLGQAMGQYRAD